MTTEEKNILLDVISFSRTNDALSTVEIIAVHQYMQLDNGLSNKIKQKIRNATVAIQDLEWKHPITRYNTEFQIEQLDTNTGNWQIIKTDEKRNQ